MRGKKKKQKQKPQDYVILSGNGKVDAAPELQAHHEDAALIHEAAIGKIAGEQLLKLQTLGLTEKEAEETIVAGFLS